jgi:tetratricopeptide (TPR) repeat protein
MKYLCYFIILLVACNQYKHEDKKLLLNEINKLEQILLADTTGNLNISAAYETIKFYSKYANSFPDDSLTPEFLFRKANTFRSLNKGKEAISVLNKIENKYPNYPKLDLCLFMKAEIYENLLNDIENAKKHYELFIQKHPNSHLTNDAKILLKNLGKTPEELFKDIISKDTLNV